MCRGFAFYALYVVESTLHLELLSGVEEFRDHDLVLMAQPTRYCPPIPRESSDGSPSEKIGMTASTHELQFIIADAIDK